MKLSKTLSIIFCSTLLSITSHVQANTVKPTEQTSKSKQMQQSLKQFNDNLSIQLIGRSIAEDQTGKKIILVKYELNNKSNKDIKAINWVSGYTFENKVIAAQNLPVNFEPVLKTKNKIVIDVEIPLEELSPQAQQLFLSSKSAIGAVIGAKRIDFTKGKPIIVE